MSKYAPVASYQLLTNLARTGYAGDYHLLLAHEVVDCPSQWEFLFKGSGLIPKGATIIMDNGLIELGEPCDAVVMKDAVDIVNATHAVLPDALEDGAETLKLSRKAMDEWLRMEVDAYYMGVVQGRSYWEIIWCAKNLWNLGATASLGIPRIWQSRFGTRKLLQFFTELLPGVHGNIHLLGMSADLKDDLTCAVLPGVMGIDSANPLVCGWNERHLDVENIQHMERGSYWRDCTFANETMLTNLDYIHSWLTNGTSPAD